MPSSVCAEHISLTMRTKDSGSIPCVSAVEADKASVVAPISHTHINHHQSGGMLTTYTGFIVEPNLCQYTTCIQNCPVPTIEDVTWSSCTAGKCGVGP